MNDTTKQTLEHHPAFTEGREHGSSAKQPDDRINDTFSLISDRGLFWGPNSIGNSPSPPVQKSLDPYEELIHPKKQTLLF